MQPHDTIRIFEGATAIVTGGASGIGRALVEELAKRGCEVVIADLQTELAGAIATQITDSGGNATSETLDVTNFAAVERIVEKTIQRTGRLDYMFNNAGIDIRGDITKYTIEDWNFILDINLRGIINGIQAAYGKMTAQGFGHMVNTASIAGLIPFPGAVSYGMTKHAVVGLSKALRAEAAIRNIRVTVLCPGYIRTPLLEGSGKYCRELRDLSPEQHRYIADSIGRIKAMEPTAFAKKALDRIARNKAIIVLPAMYNILWWINRIFPSLCIFLAQKRFQNAHKRLGLLD